MEEQSGVETYEGQTDSADIPQEAEVPPQADIQSDNTDAQAREFYNRVKELKEQRQLRTEQLLSLAASQMGVAATIPDMERALRERAVLDRINADMRLKLNKWQAESEAVRELYPEFDLRQSLKNRAFFGLCYKGLSVMQAYELTHRDEILSAAMTYAVNEARRAGVNSEVRSRAREGALTVGAAPPKTTAALTKKQRDELIRRAERGERVTLG